MLVKFHPNLTEIIFLDLEWYVPIEDRNNIGASLIANPYKENQMMLGGVLMKYKPLLDSRKKIKYEHFWIWKDGSERETITRIYQYVQSSWEKLKNKEAAQADLILCGHGISRFDVPILFIRSLHYAIDEPENIFNTFMKTKQVDLSNVAIPFFNYDKVMYPKTSNSIARRFRIQKEKETGQSVWELYDNSSYKKIEQRTESEVIDSVNLYNYLINKIYKERPR